MIDDTDRSLINLLQGGLPLVDRPFRDIGETLGLSEAQVIGRVQSLLDNRILSRFGPLFDAQRMGGGITLAAIAVPEVRFDEVTEIVNGFDEVAHNYAREHDLNMWFVVATERPERVGQVLAEIEAATGLDVLSLPKLDEYFLELKLTA